MRRILWIIAAGIIVVALGWWVAQLPGRVELAIGRYTIETSAPIAAVLAAVAVLALGGVARLLVLLATIGPSWRRWRARRRRSAGDLAVTRALVALAAAEPIGARRESARARRLLGDTAQTLLLAAEADRLAGSEEGASATYRQLAARDDAAFLGLRGLFRQAMAREDWAEAARLAARAEAAHPGALWLREARLGLAVRTADWKQAVALAGPGAPVAALCAAAASAESDADEALRLARRAAKAAPGFAPAALAYARLLRRHGKEARALAVLRAAWQAAPQPDLAELALDGTSERLARVRAAGRFVEGNPNHPESLLLCARVALDAGLTGEARRCLERARAAGLNQRRVFLLLAELEEREGGQSEAGRAAQRDALRAAAAAGPDPGWNCEKCGTALAEWRPACPVCHSAGSIVWGLPRGPVVEAALPPPGQRALEAG